MVEKLGHPGNNFVHQQGAGHRKISFLFNANPRGVSNLQSCDGWQDSPLGLEGATKRLHQELTVAKGLVCRNTALNKAEPVNYSVTAVIKTMKEECQGEGWGTRYHGVREVW